MTNLNLETDRLRLVPMDASDIDLCIQLFTDESVTKYAGGPEAEEVIHREMPKWIRRGGNGGIGIWIISDRKTNTRLGSVALLPIPVEKDDTDFDLVVPGVMPEGDIEVGYFLVPDAWGKGYATEACKRILRFGFEETPLEEIVATFDVGNTVSRKVLLKCGFKDHGTRRCYAADGPDFRITRDEWLARAASG